MTDKKKMIDGLPLAGGHSDPAKPTAQISSKLRELYDSIQSEGIPDRFLDLLEKLDQAEKSAKK